MRPLSTEQINCYLNQNLDVDVIAGYFIHEMYHGDRKKSAASPDADPSPVERDYVDRMVNEEIEGTILGFESAYKNAKSSSLASGADAPTAESRGRLEVADSVKVAMIGRSAAGGSRQARLRG